ncbi:MAG TPA: response regulator transcription factor [Symbiobacteriaceae bacterium]|jgi:two-component system response regulator ResD
MAARVLVADDEDRIRQLVRMYLTRENFEVDEAGDGQTALERINGTTYSLIILDLMLPEVDGWTVCQEVRRHSDTPIIMLSARSEEYDRILGLQLGADDYVCKPFSPRELVLRVKSLLRRTPGVTPVRGAVLQAGNLTVDEQCCQARVAGEELRLTPKEYSLLTLMIRRPGQIFSRESLLEQVWGYEFTGGRRTVDSHVKNLREKLGEAGATAQVETVWGFGYRLVTLR